VQSLEVGQEVVLVEVRHPLLRGSDGVCLARSEEEARTWWMKRIGFHPLPPHLVLLMSYPLE
jgi:hypothetical protein